MVLNFADSRHKPQRSQQIKMVIDVRTLDILCRYIMSTSAYVRMNNISNLGKMIRNLDPNTYIQEGEKVQRINFLLRALEARLDYKLTDIDMVWMHINDNIETNIDFIDRDFRELSRHEIEWVDKMVSETLQYFFVYDATDDLLDLCTRIRNSDYNTRGVLIQEFEEKIDDLKTQFRKSRVENNSTEMTFSLRSGVFEQAVTDTYNIVTSPSRRLVTGMQGLNEMLGGGFENTRVYMFVGITGVGKSVTLLNLIWQIKKYNRDYKTKDPTKTPCIVLLTMENTVVETITRLFDIAVEESMGMANYSLDEVLRKLREEGELTLSGDNPIDIVIKYKADHSIDTDWLYGMANDLEDDGYELICLVQDHVGRIRSSMNYSEQRFELGQVVNDFKIFAAEKDIPVISNTHFNREAMKLVDDAMNRSLATDVTKKLGKGLTAESVQMQNNLDMSISINTDYDAEGNKYMAFFTAKMRDKGQRNYIAQPFVYGSGIRLVEDYGTVPMFKESLHQNVDINRVVSIRTTSSSAISGVTNEYVNNQGRHNTFTNEGVYSFTVRPDEYDDYDAPAEIQEVNIVSPIIFKHELEKRDNIVDLQNMRSNLANRQATMM